jgi:hypothetical protein
MPLETFLILHDVITEQENQCPKIIALDNCAPKKLINLKRTVLALLKPIRNIIILL